MRILYALIILFNLFFIVVEAQQIAPIDSLKIDSLGLDELLKLKSTGVSSEMEKQINEKIGVASKKPLSSRQSPSIITVITDDEIQKSGARDIVDVLSMVPGFTFGADVLGNLGLGVRGNWANEGKILVLLDGQEMNETLFGNVAFGNNYPISQIKRIEVIRGPGSAIYGGFAEYGVVNIITKKGEEINGVQANALYGQMNGTYGHRNLSLSVGKKIKDFDISLAGMIGQGNRSNQNYTDVYGNSYNMSGNSQSNPIYANLGVTYKSWSMRLIYDNLNTTNRDNTTAIVSQAYPNNFKSIFAELKYDKKISDKFTITPKFNFKQQTPWNYTGTPAPNDSSYTYYNKTAYRYRGNVTASWDVHPSINLVFGGETFIDHAIARGDSSQWFVHHNSSTDSSYTQTVTYYNFAGFAQAIYKNKIANLIAGFRYDRNSAYGYAFVPRIGLTKKVGIFNFKLLYSNSFRAPTIENVSLAVGGIIKPEKTGVFEFEVGVQTGRNGYLTANIFDITTQNPIIYNVSINNLNGSYLNGSSMGSQGVELEYKWKHKRGFINANYSFYTTANKPTISNYEVPGNSAVNMGFPSHKVFILCSYNITKNLSINPSFNFQSVRYGYTAVDASGNLIASTLGPSYLLNLNLQYDDLFVKGLSVAIACYDILGQNYKFVTPYSIGHAPLPGPSREFTLRLAYNIPFKK